MDTPQLNNPSHSFSMRCGEATDTYTAFLIFERSLADLNRRIGSTEKSSKDDPAALARMWKQRQSFFEHLTNTADQFWIAEEQGKAIGYARSILRGDVRVLTELFVLPEGQSIGVGRALMALAFPAEETNRKVLISSPDLRAQALYLCAGVYPRSPAYYFGRQPEPVRVSTDLHIEPAVTSTSTLNNIGVIDLIVLGHRRDADHIWLQTVRQGYLYYWGGRPVGYGYVGKENGPFALLNETDYPAVLAHAETVAAAAGADHVGFEVPGVNQAAVAALLSRDYQIGAFVVQFMTDKPLGDLSRYIITSPPFIL